MQKNQIWIWNCIKYITWFHRFNLDKIYAFTHKIELFRYRSIKYGKAQPSSEAKRPSIKTTQEETKVCTVPIIEIWGSLAKYI